MPTPPGRFIDAHCHLADPKFAARPGGVEAVIDRCFAAGAVGFVQGGVDPEDWARQDALAAGYPGVVVPVYGLHPWSVIRLLGAASGNPERALTEKLAGLQGRMRNAAGVGEIGLDFGRRALAQAGGPATVAVARALQMDAFVSQLELAREFKKPVVLHIVKAHPEALALLRTEGLSERGGLVHAFAADAKTALGYFELGLTLSIGARALREIRWLDELAKAFRRPWFLERIVLESDSPDQAPDPLAVPVIAERIADILRVDRDEVLGVCADNVRRIFSF